jgi:hypothetical protein
MADMCTNTSAPPESGVIKPKPLVALNHLMDDGTAVDVVDRCHDALLEFVF